MKTETLSRVTIKKCGNKPTGTLSKFYVSYYVAVGDDSVKTVWHCIISDTSRNSAYKTAQKYKKAVVELTNCLGEDEFRDIGVDDCIGTSVVPLDEFIKNLEEGTDVLVDTLNQLDKGD